MYCPSCGSELPPNANFCPECGLSFDNAKSTAQPVPSIAPRRSPPSERPVQAPAPAQPVARPRDKPKASKIIISAILVFALLGSVFAVVTVVTWGTYTSDASYSHVPATPSSTSTWIFHADLADMNIIYTSNASAPEVQVNVHYDFAGAFLAGKTAGDLFTEDWDNASTVKHFYLNSKNWWTFPMIENNLVTITLRTGVEYNITATTATGSSTITVPNNENLTSLAIQSSTGSISASLGTNITVFGNVTINSMTGSSSLVVGNSTNVTGPIGVSASTGSVHLDIQDNCKVGIVMLHASTGNIAADIGNSNLTGGFSAETSTGSSQLRLTGTILGDDINASASTGSVDTWLTNITYASNIHFNIMVSTGSIYANITQLINPGANLTSSMNASTGSVDVGYKADDAVTSAMFASETDIGDIDYTNINGFLSPVGNTFQSANYPSPRRMTFQIRTNTGGIRVSGQMI